MARKKIPSIDELRDYQEKQKAYLQDCIKNHKTFVISGPKFQGENIWVAKSTLPLMEAAKEVGASPEEIWQLCSKLSTLTHAPITKKEYERMIPFSKKPHTVDTVLQFLENNIPQYNQKRHCLDFDIVAYFYCYALISLSDYRQEDCQKKLWCAVNDFIEKDRNMAMVLLRNMKVLEHTRSFLTPMKEKLEKAIEWKEVNYEK